MRKVNKSEKIREFLKDNPDAKPSEVKEGLAKEGVIVGTGLISNLKHQMKYRRPTTHTQAQPVTSFSSSNKPITLDEMTAVISVADQIGGIGRLHEVVKGVEQVQAH